MYNNDAMINTGNKYIQILKVFGYCQLAKYQTKFNNISQRDRAVDKPIPRFRLDPEYEIKSTTYLFR